MNREVVEPGKSGVHGFYVSIVVMHRVARKEALATDSQEA